MKKIISNIAILFTIIMSSCTNLDENPMDFVSPENTYGDINTFESMILGCYGKFKAGCSSNMWVTAGNQAYSDNLDFTRYAVTPNNGSISGVWDNYYTLINNANSILENVDKATNAADGQQNQIIGQASFLRAISYFYLVRYFSDVPLMLNEVKTPDALYDLTRTPQQDVYNAIISDLQKAEEFLPNSWDGAPGKATKYAAKSLLSKVYLTMAGAPLKQADKYAMAAAKAKEVIDAGAFNLGDNFEDLFIPSKQNAHSSIIFQAICVTGRGSTFAAPFYTTVSFLQGQSNPGMRVYGEFMDNFPEGPRKEATFYTVDQPGVFSYLNEKNEDGTYKNADYHDANVDRKYFVKSGEPFGYTDKFAHIGAGEGLLIAAESDQNVLIFRYAEILLIYAEAQARADGTPNADAYKAINDVRKRAYGVETPLAAGLSKDAFVDAVIQERFYELAFESKRWFDVVRLELPLRYEIYLKEDNYAVTVKNAANPNRYLMPIPLAEIELNPNLTQNEGY